MTSPPPSATADVARLAAFLLPQFHPVPINDQTWGPGFTEWHTVVRARPRFRGHAQPVLPADLGFYDLRLAETRIAQAQLALRYGISAFCWYHYWFDGVRLLHEPFDRMRGSPDEQFPFLLCWANETWTRNWSGHSGTTIVAQRYSPEDDLAHARWLVENAFSDPRYVTVRGRPVFLIYQPKDLPEPQRTCATIRRVVTDAGLAEPLLLAVSSFRSVLRDAKEHGFDGVVPQQPDLNIVRPAWRAAPRWLGHRLHLVRHRYPDVVRFPYPRLVDRVLASHEADQDGVWPTVCPRWDNSPRRAPGAVVLTDSLPCGLREVAASDAARDRQGVRVRELVERVGRGCASGARRSMGPSFSRSDAASTRQCAARTLRRARLRICILHNTGPGGALRMIGEVAQRLGRTDEVTVITWNDVADPPLDGVTQLHRPVRTLHLPPPFHPFGQLLRSWIGSVARGATGESGWVRRGLCLGVPVGPGARSAPETVDPDAVLRP